jgi:hypothetical protein
VFRETKLWQRPSGRKLRAALAGRVSEQGAPFQVPPAAQLDELFGRMDFEAPSTLAFDSANRPYMFDSEDALCALVPAEIRKGRARWTRSLP